MSALEIALVALVILMGAWILRLRSSKREDTLGQLHTTPATATPVAPKAPPSLGSGESTIVLLQPGSKKIPVIKIVREAANLGLKEAKVTGVECA